MMKIEKEFRNTLLFILMIMSVMIFFVVIFIPLAFAQIPFGEDDQDKDNAGLTFGYLWVLPNGTTYYCQLDQNNTLTECAKNVIIPSSDLEDGKKDLEDHLKELIPKLESAWIPLQGA